MSTSSQLNGIVCLELGAGTGFSSLNAISILVSLMTQMSSSCLLLPGLLGILLARVAKAVFLTGAQSDISSSPFLFLFLKLFPSSFTCTLDYGDQVLGNCLHNVELNSALFNPQAVVNVRELNWMSQWPITQDSHGDSQK